MPYQYAPEQEWPESVGHCSITDHLHSHIVKVQSVASIHSQNTTQQTNHLKYYYVFYLKNIVLYFIYITYKYDIGISLCIFVTATKRLFSRTI
jgi:hypothetical protein